MEHPGGLISALAFKQLLVDLREKRPDICIRYRMLGEMWTTNFMSVFIVRGTGVMLYDELNHKIVSISDVANIMQFEIDSPFNGYQPYYHYEVHPLLDYEAHR